MSNIHPYAGFWKRAAAWLIDSILLYVANMVIIQVATLINADRVAQWQQLAKSPGQLDMSLFAPIMGFATALIAVQVLVPWLYFAFMESSSKQATVGKMTLGIKVVDERGNRLSFWHALGRTLAKIISGLTLNIGYYMAGATRKKQALHDKLAGTYVVDKAYKPGDTLPEVETHFGILTAVIFGELAILFLIIASFIGLIFVAIQSALNNNKNQPPQQTQTVVTQPVTQSVVPVVPVSAADTTL